MKSVYQSIKSIINERLGAVAAAQVDANKPKPKLTPMQTAVTNVRNQNLPKPAATDKPQAAMVPTKKVAVSKPAQSTTAPAPSQDKLNATQRSAEKSGPDTDAMKKGIAATPAVAPKVEPKVAEPKAAEPAEVPDSVEVTNKEASATKPNDSGGMRGNFSTVKDSSDSGEPSKPSGSPMAGVKSNTADKPQAAMAPPAADNTVKDSSGNVVRSGDGSPVRTRTDAEIERDNKKGRGRGMSMESINKKFNVSDALYTSVMEVMKSDKKEGSIPRNDKEKELAAAYGDPKRITHGDVLKMRGVTKEEAEQTDEATLSAKAARAGKDIGKPGKAFSKIAASAAKRYGSEEAGKRVAGAVLKKMRMKEEAEQANEGIMDKVLPILTGGSDKDLLKKLQKDMGVPQTGQKPAPAPAKPVKENKDTPGNGYAHQCAVHVKSESFGEGRTITTQHADPDADGNIAWYDVMFEHGIEKQVPTSTLEILVSENHMHMKKKKM